MPLLELVVIGLAVGLVMGITGAGGGVLAVPLLVLLLGWDMTRAAPTALLAVGAAAALGAAIGFRQRNLRYRAAGFMGAIGALLAPLGVYLAHALPELALSLSFAAILALVSYHSFRPVPAAFTQGAHPCMINPATGRFTWTAPCAKALALAGASAGLLSGLFGVGGGFVLVPVLGRVTDLTMLSIVPTTLAAIAIVSSSSIASAFAQGSFDVSASLPFIAAALVGLASGRAIARRLPPELSRRAFGVLAAGTALSLALRSLA
jgi:uncharacterized membrane protein YfcA